MQHYEEQLNSLKQMLLTMASRAEQAVSNALKALQDRDDHWADEVGDDDGAIDQLEVKIDEQAIRLLSNAPVADHLRLITTAMRISQNLERVGDEATTIARRARRLNTEPLLRPTVDVSEMAKIALGMLDEALEAFVARAPERAAAVVPRDKTVDQMNREFQSGMTRKMEADPKTIQRGLDLIFISKSLERIADHAANIAEEVVYLYEARDIRHSLHNRPT